MFEPHFAYRDFITEKTLTVHLWNERIKKLKPYPPPKGSFIYDICKKHNINPWKHVNLAKYLKRGVKQKLKQVREWLTK